MFGQHCSLLVAVILQLLHTRTSPQGRGRGSGKARGGALRQAVWICGSDERGRGDGLWSRYLPNPVSPRCLPQVLRPQPPHLAVWHRGGTELLAGGVAAVRMLEWYSLTFSVSGNSAELQLRADAGSPPPALRRNSGAWEWHVAQDLRPAAQQQTHLFHRCQQGDCSAAGQHPAARPYPEFVWRLQQEPFGWEAVFPSPHCLATCSLMCWWL